MDRLRALHDAGVSIWLDSLSRDLLNSGDLAHLVKDRFVTGATSNPTIFATAITRSDSYRDQLARLAGAGERDPREMFFALALEDVRRAAEVFRPVYDATHGGDGLISFECTPDLANDTAGTVAQARKLWRRINQPNAMIKVPGTVAGIEAVEVLTGDGINVNVTLLFSVDRAAAFLQAYQRGLHQRLDRGDPLEHVRSVASFFVSRVDTAVDAVLPEGSPLRGRVAVANAAVAFSLYEKQSAAPLWPELAAAGATPQRPLWASTGTKNPDYSDLLYVESLIAPGTVNTMPLATLDAFADHGDSDGTIVGVDVATDTLRRVSAAGVDLNRVTADLERAGVESFCASYAEILDCITRQVAGLRAPR